MPDRSLDVWLLGERIGRLDQTEGRLSFTYDVGSLHRPDAVPLSASLPLQANAFDHRAARPFFAGLLPEQDRRDQVARTIGVSGRNDLALLDALGGECAGAVTFTAAGLVAFRTSAKQSTCRNFSMPCYSTRLSATMTRMRRTTR